MTIRRKVSGSRGDRIEEEEITQSNFLLIPGKLNLIAP